MHHKKEIVGDSLSKGFSPFRLHITIKVWNQKRDKINGLICSPKIFNIMNRLCINKNTSIWYYINIIILTNIQKGGVFMARPAEAPLNYLGGKKKLSATEFEFMKFIWKHPEGVSSEEIYQAFPQARGTKSTILYHLSEKGYVDKKQSGLHHFYTVLVTQEEYEQALLRQQIEGVLGNTSFERLVAAFCGKTLSKAQIEKTRNLLKELEDELEDK